MYPVGVLFGFGTSPPATLASKAFAELLYALGMFCGRRFRYSFFNRATRDLDDRKTQ